jgi:hypothetical protein
MSLRGCCMSGLGMLLLLTDLTLYIPCDLVQYYTVYILGWTSCPDNSLKRGSVAAYRSRTQSQVTPIILEYIPMIIVSGSDRRS